MKENSCPSDPSTRATASGRAPSLGIGSRAKGSLRGVALSGAQRSRREAKWVPRALPGGTQRRMPFILALIFLVTVSGCAPVLFKKPLSDQEVRNVVSLLKAQEESVNAFYTSGQMVVKDWYWDQEANTLMAGTRTPLRLRMEITHAWGQPILHLLVVGKTFKALSYGERKLYIGDLNPGALSKFFPADLGADLIWEVLRGFPKLGPDGRMESRKADQVTLLGQNGDEMEILELDPESGLPRRISFPERKVAVDYKDFQQEDGILYAKEVRVTQLGGTRNLTLKNGKMVFNKPIPDEIFRMEMPPGFETEYIDKTNLKFQ